MMFQMARFSKKGNLCLCFDTKESMLSKICNKINVQLCFWDSLKFYYHRFWVWYCQHEHFFFQVGVKKSNKSCEENGPASEISSKPVNNQNSEKNVKEIEPVQSVDKKVQTSVTSKPVPIMRLVSETSKSAIVTSVTSCVKHRDLSKTKSDGYYTRSSSESSPEESPKPLLKTDRKEIDSCVY